VQATVAYYKENTTEPSNSSLPFMETECSLPCSQKPATGPYPEPDESSPHDLILFPYVAV
jgi:hypothetical protein